MSTTALDVDSRQRAPPLEEGVLDLAQYTLEQVRRDAELVLFRGLRKVREEGSRPSILVRVPVEDAPAPATVRSLQEEYALRSELDSAYVVRSLSLVQDHGRPMLILEDPFGTPLDLLVNGAMDITQFLRLGIRVAAALGHVHSRGLVHKDIKPANILVNAALTQAWLMGLGMASRLPRERRSGQLSEFLVGTLAYMAPEQTGRMNRSIDSRSDLYGLGVTFYEMLTGTLPFTASDPMELVHCHIARRPISPSDNVNGVPLVVSTIIMKLLAKTAEERYQTAAGVESDLRRCLTEWETQHRIDEFPLGEHDTPDRLLIPEKLYGRESEIDALLAAFDRVVAGGKPELVLVSGYSGIGKSSVVNELHKSLVPPRGLFASGKFDQYKRDIPYATLAQAFRSLVQRLLGKSEADLAPWRDSLRDALGANGRLIIELVPELELIIGHQPPAPDLPPQDARRRFQLIFRRFIGVFARPEHPLALFLDDLQWLDAATLDLLEELLTGPGAAPSDLQHLMLIGAYRTNEVSSAHPLRQKLEAIETSGGAVVEITLAPLAPEHLQQLLSQALRCEAERAAPLARLVHEKTGGNPFFANRFIASLAEEGMLTFDHDAGRWSWDLGRIRAKGYADNLVDLMVGKLTRLTAETQKAVQQLACLGNAAAVATLGLVYGTPETEIHSLLDEAVRADLLERGKDSYHFIHDRIQEAAYLLLPESSRAEAHLRIGRLLAANTPPEQREEAIYEIVNQLNRGAPLITSDDERVQLAELNLIAGKRAKVSSAYVSALTYFARGADLLPDDAWESRHDLAFALQLHQADCELWTGALSSAEKGLAALATRAVNVIQRAAVAGRRVDLYTMLGASDRAVDVGLEYLRHVNIDWAAHPTEIEARREYEQIWSDLGSREIEDLIELPLMENKESLATLDVLTTLAPPALYTDENLWALTSCRVVNLSLERGNSDAAAAHYASVGLISAYRFGDYDVGYRLGKTACALIERRDLTRFGAKVYALFALLVPWRRPAREGIDPAKRAFQLANESGDPTFAAYACRNLTSILLASGEPLDHLAHQAEQGLEFSRRVQFGFAADMISAPLAFIRTLRGETAKFGSLDHDDFTERSFEERLTGHPAFALPECSYWIRKLQARYFAGDYASAIDAADKAERWVSTSASLRIKLLERAEYHLYAALSRAACCEPSDSDGCAKYREALAAHHAQLRAWAVNCPENFEDRAALVGAEIARIEGRVADAMDLYEHAIRAARANGLVQNEALAYELAARFYGLRGFEEFAHIYLRHALDGYRRWGAVGKVRQLQKLHPEFVGQEPSVSTSAVGASGEHLDLATVIKVSQAVSSEMVIEKLIETFMRTALEQAGAERGLLILTRGTEQRAAAEAMISGDTVTVQACDENVSAAVLPQSVFRHVVRTQESLTLEDASAQNPFSADPYFGRQRTRSVLCLPLLNRGTLVGVLYLENNLASRVFAAARVPVLKLLASQAAISLENSRLYRDLAQREAKIRQLVDATIVGLFIWDLDGAILEANDAFLRMMGYEREDLVSGRLRWGDLSAAQWLGRDRQDLGAEIQRTGSLQPFEWEHIRKDGSRMPVLIGAASFEGENQGVSFVLDLTERKRAEHALRRSEAHLAEAQRLTHTGSWAFDPSAGKVVYWSDEMFRIYGRDSRRESLPTYEELLRYVHPDDRDGFNKATERGRGKAEMTFDFRIVMADGSVRHVHSTRLPVVDETGMLVETVGTLVDVTERRHAEQRLLMQYRVTRILADDATLEEATAKILQTMCECLGWDLGAVWGIDPKAGVLRCEELWRTSSIEAVQFETATRKSTFRSGSGLPGRVWETGAPAYIADVGHDVAFRRVDSAARQVLRAAIAFPIVLGREVIGVIGFISRDVSQPDQELLVVLANIGSQIGQFTERKGVEQALRRSEAYLAEAQRLTHTGSWVYDHILGKVKHYSDETFRLYGLDPRRPSGPPQLEETRQLIHPQDRERVFVQLAQILRDKTEYEQQFRIVLSDGTVRHMHSIGHPVLNKAGELVEYFGSVMDVTERRHAEHRLLVQHRVTRILAESVTVDEAIPKILEMIGEWPGWDLGALWQNDRHAGVLRCAELWRTPSLEAAQFEAVTRMSTFSPGRGLPGRVWASGAPAYIADVTRDPNFPRADIAAREGLRGAFAFPILVGREVLGIIEFFSRDVWQADPNLLDMMANIGRQIGQFTERAAAVKELYLRVNMLQQIPVAAWSVTPDGTPDIVNQLWYEYTGQTPDFVNSHPEAWMATLHPEDRERASESYWDGIRSGRGFTMEARFLRARDGTYRWHLNRAVPVRDPEGNLLRLVGTSTDVHDWRQAQEALRNTQTEFAHMTRVMTMGELTASIAHEVNQPLGAMVTSAAAGARWLATKPPQLDKARRALERIADDGKRAAEVIRRIRALMKRQAPRKEWLDINETILEVIALAHYQLRRSAILLETRLGHHLPLVRGDRVQLQQVLLNLVINAIEAMSGIKERPRELTIVSSSDGPDTVSVEVRDSGTGLDPAHALHVFEPFYTTKAEGLGIGLSISLSIVEAHGGRLSAAANAPHGTVFLFSLPVNEQAP